MRLPREGGDMRLPGEGPHDVGIDRKSNGARRRCCGGSVRSTLHEAPHELGIDRKANRRLAAGDSAVHSHRPFGGAGVTRQTRTHG